MDPEALFARLKAEYAGQRALPVETWKPTVNGAIAIHIDGQGRWFHEGDEIRRPELVRLFSRILRRDPDGYVLVTPAERLLIEVDDVPFLAVDFERRSATADGVEPELLFRTNVDDLVLVDREHPLWMSSGAEARPYLRVRPGLDARITRAAFYRLLEHVEFDGPTAFVRSCGTRFLLGNV